MKNEPVFIDEEEVRKRLADSDARFEFYAVAFIIKTDLCSFARLKTVVLRAEQESGHRWYIRRLPCTSIGPDFEFQRQCEDDESYFILWVKVPRGSRAPASPLPGVEITLHALGSVVSKIELPQEALDFIAAAPKCPAPPLHFPDGA